MCISDHIHIHTHARMYTYKHIRVRTCTPTLSLTSPCVTFPGGVSSWTKIFVPTRLETQWCYVMKVWFWVPHVLKTLTLSCE